MLHTFTRFENRLSLQWDYLNPIVTEQGNVLRMKQKRNNVVYNRRPIFSD